MKSNTTTILVAVGALLVGGVATAAFLKGGDKSPTAQDGLVTAADGALVADDAAATDNQLPAGTLQYAEVVKAEPITSSEKLYATVIGTEPVRETTTTSTPREVCEDVVVQERLPERDGNAGGTVAGAVIGAGALFAARRLFPQRYAALAAWAAAGYLTKKWAERAEARKAAEEDFVHEREGIGQEQRDDEERSRDLEQGRIAQLAGPVEQRQQ